MGIRRPPLSKPVPTRRQSTLWTARPGPCAAGTNLEDARLVTGGRKRLRAPPLEVAGPSPRLRAVPHPPSRFFSGILRGPGRTARKSSARRADATKAVVFLTKQAYFYVG